MKLKYFIFNLFFCVVAVSAAWAQEDVPRFGYKVVKTYPHDINAFTQGLVFRDGYLFEGTGKNGQSSLSKVLLDDGSVQLTTPLNRRYFGEGIEVVGDKIYQLTWRSNMVFVYDKDSFQPTGNHYNATEGWGLAFDGTHLIMSDGTATLQFMNPETFAPERKVEVTLNGNPIIYLNELEFIDGEVWANVWQTDYIVRIDPATGKVVSLVDMTGLSQQTQLGSSEAVLNGIAWDEQGQRLFVTGKHWSNLFEIELVAP
jgi:glutamine cyclotransferase